IFSSSKEYPNVGVVSFAHCRHDPLDLYCLLNVVHELGHSWGASHDDIEECTPRTGGAFLMGGEPFLGSKGPNNMLFSPCSIRAIYVTIDQIDPAEFRSFCQKCGNGIVELPEQCDEGIHAGHCCSQEC